MPARRKGPLETSLAEVLNAEPLNPRDHTIGHLAMTYARAIDSGQADLTKLGPQLQSALESLLLSPRARAMAMRGLKANDRPGTAKLDELHARRLRKSNPQDLHAAPGNG
jgi:hypothetical protein